VSELKERRPWAEVLDRGKYGETVGSPLRGEQNGRGLVRHVARSWYTGVLFSSSVVLFLRGRTVSSYYRYSVPDVCWWSYSLISVKHFTCFLGCVGDSNIALATTSISGVLGLTLFPEGYTPRAFKATRLVHSPKVLILAQRPE
jgi:hypothetical protein